MFAIALLLVSAAQLTEQQRLFLDWGGLTRYGSDNTELKTPPQAVFLGDELTEEWAPFFPGKPYLNRGIEHQTAAQMLVRFRQDVIALKPKVVVIHAGMNDIGRVLGPTPEWVIADHLRTMTELAQLHGIKVVLASMTPVCDCAGNAQQSKKRSVPRLLSLNGWIKEYAAGKQAIYLDYWSALVEGRFIKREYTVDGFRLSEAGYLRMLDAAEKAIAAALAAQ